MKNPPKVGWWVEWVTWERFAPERFAPRYLVQLYRRKPCLFHWNPVLEKLDEKSYCFGPLSRIDWSEFKRVKRPKGA